ncbi:hypothetical protein BKA70DRAFT_1563801 [Coprinopsis sp. MPI-PUGE-AT-0042]|nr:hypothetical protein BKA70DRAFT_1563801 [Coprinopsis sp. MPI-PUGE-AT-0042]
MLFQSLISAALALTSAIASPLLDARAPVTCPAERIKTLAQEDFTTRYAVEVSSRLVTIALWSAVLPIQLAKSLRWAALNVHGDRQDATEKMRFPSYLVTWKAA